MERQNVKLKLYKSEGLIYDPIPFAVINVKIYLNNLEFIISIKKNVINKELLYNPNNEYHRFDKELRLFLNQDFKLYDSFYKELNKSIDKLYDRIFSSSKYVYDDIYINWE